MNKQITTERLRKLTIIDYEVWKKMSRGEKEELKKRVSKWENEWAKWLFKDEGVENNPKKDKCFGLAWEEGHSSGYEEVENYFRELVELIK